MWFFSEKENIFLKHLIFLFVLCLNFFSFYSFSIILESKSLKDILDHVYKNNAYKSNINKSLKSLKNKDVVVVFDIDSTIAYLEHDIEYLVCGREKELLEKGFDKNYSIDLALCEYFVISKKAKLFPIDSSPEIIMELQKKHIPVIALTNRSIPVIYSTVKSLKNIGINFGKNAIFCRDLDLAVSHKGFYHKNIIFSGKNDKGKMLAKFFDTIGYKPKKIIFVDDNKRNVESVDKAFAGIKDLECICLRFGFMDEKKKNFDLNNAKSGVDSLKIEVGLEPLR